MKLMQVDKLYAAMSGEEKANMAFNAIARQDDATYSAIMSSMPMQYFIGVDLSYRRRYYELINLSSTYGLLWFSHKVQLMNDDSAIAKLSAIHAALVEVCDRYGLDIESVKKIGLCRLEVIPDWDAPTGLVEEYTEIFNKVFE